MLRQLPRIYRRNISTDVQHAFYSTNTFVSLPSRTESFTVSDPPSVSAAHPRDSTRTPQDSVINESSPPMSQPKSDSSNVPMISTPREYTSIALSHPSSLPPFHTHTFFKELEKAFPTPTARSLMRATHALLADRISQVHNEGLTTKDLDNQAYLFRAALSEMKAEFIMNTKNDSAAIKASNMALRREIDHLDVKMKAEIEILKHEIQIILDSRKNEIRADLKEEEIDVEDLVNKSIVSISDLRSDVEEIKWNNMRRAVLSLGSFTILTIVVMELRPKPPLLPPLPPVAPVQSEVNDPVAGHGDRTEWT